MKQTTHDAVSNTVVTSPTISRPQVTGTFGVVVSTHWLASAVGMSVLERGGNAFDAAVAVGFALQIVEPNRYGPGGEVPILLCEANTDKVSVICGQGVTPAAATSQKFAELELGLIPGTGLLSACVPGQFDAWMLLLLKWGTMSLRDVMSYTIDLARNGTPITPRVCETIAGAKDLFQDHWPTSAALFLPGGEVPKPWTLFKNPTLADTYERIVRDSEASGGTREQQIEKARQIWSKGFVAQAIDRFCHEGSYMDETGRCHSGLLTAEDMASWEATIEKPLSYQYKNYTVFKVGPWSQAPAMLQQLALLNEFDLDSMDPMGPDFIHTVMECAKLSYADREKFYGDPNFTDVPMDVLLSPEYNKERRKLVGDKASFDLTPGNVPGYGGEVTFKTHEELVASGVITFGPPSGDTTHFDIIDRWGNMVSATPSGGWLQRSPTIPELGFCLGTRGQMFWLKEGLPGSIAPKKRPRTTLSPNLAFKDGRPYMAFGTPGGDKQDQWSLSFFLRHVHHGMNLQEAIDAPQFHTAHFPASFYPRASNPGHLSVEGRMPQATIDELRARGHLLEVSGGWSQGRFAATAKEGGVLKAAAHQRFMEGFGYAAGR